MSPQNNNDVAVSKDLGDLSSTPIGLTVSSGVSTMESVFSLLSTPTDPLCEIASLPATSHINSKLGLMEFMIVFHSRANIHSHMHCGQRDKAPAPGIQNIQACGRDPLLQKQDNLTWKLGTTQIPEGISHGVVHCTLEALLLSTKELFWASHRIITGLLACCFPSK